MIPDLEWKGKIYSKGEKELAETDIWYLLPGELIFIVGRKHNSLTVLLGELSEYRQIEQPVGHYRVQITLTIGYFKFRLNDEKISFILGEDYLGHRNSVYKAKEKL